MKVKINLLFVLAAFALLSGCYDDDKLWNAVNKQEQRIEALESWQKLVNSNIEALQILVSGKHYITAVTPVTLEGKTVGYTISFNDCDPITIYNGEKGEQGGKGDQGPAGSTPVISITQQDDGNWYWTLNGELITGTDGNPIRANGEDGTDGKPGQNAPIPILKPGQALIDAGIDGTWIPTAIYLSVDNGKTWTKVSGTDGNSMFSKVDDSDEEYVIFTLADGTEIKVPKYKGVSLKLVIPNTRPWSDPWELGECVVIPCHITYPASSTHQIEIIAPKGWKAEMNSDENELKVTAPKDVDLGIADYQGKLIVMLNVDDDPSIIRTLDLKLTDHFDFTYGNEIANLLTRHGYKGTSLTVSGGAMTSADFEALRTNTTIQTLDLSGMMFKDGQSDDYYTIPNTAFHSNLTLQKIILPKKLKVIGDSAFCKCIALQEIEIPENVKIIPPRAFYHCRNLEKVVLPEGLTTIQGGEKYAPEVGSKWSLGAFGECESLKEINIPSSCKEIGTGAFYMAGTFAGTNERVLELQEGTKLFYFSFCRYNMTKLILNKNIAGESHMDINRPIPATEVFLQCALLKEVIFRDGATHSPGENNDFKECKKLEKVTFPPSFKTIHPGMFAGCENLRTIIWPISTVDGLKIDKGTDNDPFKGVNEDCKIYVPADLVTPMRNKFSEWKNLFAPI